MRRAGSLLRVRVRRFFRLHLRVLLLGAALLAVSTGWCVYESEILFVAHAQPRYLRDWAFEGLVRVATNGRLDQLRFLGNKRAALECTPREDALPGAYVTTLGTADHLPGVRVLVRVREPAHVVIESLSQAHALRTGGASHPLLVLLPHDLPLGTEQALLEDESAFGNSSSFSVQMRRVGRLRYPPGWTTAGCRYWWLNAAGHYAELEHSLTKLWAFSLTEYKRVVYLDADVLPLRAPDELFGLWGGAGLFFAAAPDWGRHGGDAPGFNAGVFAASTCAGLREELLQVMAEQGHDARCHRRGTADQPLLQYFFGLDTIGLPLKYNVLQPGHVRRPGLVEPVMLHFTKHKPWEVAGGLGVSEWRAVCQQVGCCERGACDGRRVKKLPRGPHFRRKEARRAGRLREEADGEIE